jgi:UDP-N-acetylmuramoyl-tripeptide--D-alanyl-D-alanine ligase
MKDFFKKIITAVLSYEAALILKKYNPKIVAVTGSVGKTTTKDAVYSVLSKKFVVRRSEKSFNSEIGIPLTILGCQNGWSNPFLWIKNIFHGLSYIIHRENYPDWLVLEVGADHPGDIKSVTKWLKPDIVVLTKFAKTPVHIEFFKNRDEIIKEKGYLVEALKHDGTLILNADDADSMSFKGKYNHKTITYGIDGLADVQATFSDLYYEDKKLIGMQFKADYFGNSVPIIIKNTVGDQVVYATLAAATVGIACDLNLVEASQGIIDYNSPAGRMKLIPGIKESLIIDDTYNSSPVAAFSALDTLKRIKLGRNGRRIAVLGDMLELGKHSAEEHENLGKRVGDICDMLLTVGLRTRATADTALSYGLEDKDIFQFEKSEEAGRYLQNLIKKNDVILVKGSQSMRMERCVEEIMAEPEKASDLLVRQEEEWKKKR